MINNSQFNIVNNFNQIRDLENGKSLEFIEKYKQNISKSYPNNKIKEVTQEFESLLVNEMFKTMNKNISLFEDENIPEEEIFIKKNQTEKIFNDFLTYEKSKIAVSSGNINLGLAEAIIEQFKN